MHFFLKATPAPRLRSKNILFVAVYLAAFFVVAAASQLFSFEDFPSIISSFGLPIDQAFIGVVAALVVTLEVLAVPSLLQMKLTPVLRGLSIVAGWLVLVWWLGIGVWQSVVEFKIPNGGLFGPEIAIPCGWWLVLYMVILIILNGYVAWGTYSSRYTN